MLEPVRDCTFQSDLVGILLGTEQMYVQQYHAQLFSTDICPTGFVNSLLAM